jgi:hypothetical protein
MLLTVKEVSTVLLYTVPPPGPDSDKVNYGIYFV